MSATSSKKPSTKQSQSAEAPDVPVQISHHKACGGRNWGKVKTTLQMIREARGEGMDVTADQYPYAATSTSLSIFLPNWAHDGGDKALHGTHQEPGRAAVPGSPQPTRETATLGSTATGQAC